MKTNKTSNMKDITRNSVIAGVAAVPYAGGPLSFLLDKYIPSEAEKRRNEFLQKLSDDIQELKDKAVVFDMDSPEFHSIFLKLLKASMEEYRHEKINSFRNLALNSLLIPEQLNKIDFYTRLAIQLIPDEIKILYVLYLLDVKRDPSIADNGERRDLHAILKKYYHFEDKEYVSALMVDCMRYTLIGGSPALQKKEERAGIFMTDLGREFASYIFEPNEVLRDESKE